VNGFLAKTRRAHDRSSFLPRAGLVSSSAMVKKTSDTLSFATSGRDQVEERIRLALSVPAAEMIHLAAATTHIAADRPEVQHALRHASRLPGDPVDHLERCLDDLLATLHSPKVRHAVAKLAGELVRAPGGEMGADDVLRSIVVAMGETPADDHPGHPRRIYVR
jgi:hypothetical protein